MMGVASAVWWLSAEQQRLLTAECERRGSTIRSVARLAHLLGMELHIRLASDEIRTGALLA